MNSASFSAGFGDVFLKDSVDALLKLLTGSRVGAKPGHDLRVYRR